MPTPYRLVGALLGGLLQLLESGDPASLLRLVLGEDEDLALQPHTALLVAGDAEDGRDELGPSMDDIVGGHLTHFKSLVPGQHNDSRENIFIGIKCCNIWDNSSY